MISTNNILDREIRRRIYQFISENPGFHRNIISKKLNIPRSTLLHHLRFLEKQNLISTTIHKGYTRYFVSGKFGKIDKVLLNFLREETTRNIILMFLYQTACSQIEMSEELNKTPATILYHLKRLSDADIVEVAPIHNGIVQRLTYPQVVMRSPIKSEKIYRLKSKQVIRAIYSLITTYEKSFLEGGFPKDYMHRLKENMKLNGCPYIKLFTPDDSLNSMMEAFFDIFPHPYHV